MLGLVAVMNVVNLSDGIDGLAAGVCAISAGGARRSSRSTCSAPRAACSPRSPPARRSASSSTTSTRRRSTWATAGRTCSASCSAASPCSARSKTNAVLALIFPLIVLAVPFLDTTFVVLKRMKYHRPVYAADREHFHHRLDRIGFSTRRTVLYLYAWTLSLAGLAIALRFVPYSDNGGTLHLGWAAVMAALGLLTLHRVGLPRLRARDPEVQAPRRRAAAPRQADGDRGGDRRGRRDAPGDRRVRRRAARDRGVRAAEAPDRAAPAAPTTVRGAMHVSNLDAAEPFRSTDGSIDPRARRARVAAVAPTSRSPRRRCRSAGRPTSTTTRSPRSSTSSSRARRACASATSSSTCGAGDCVLIAPGVDPQARGTPATSRCGCCAAARRPGRPKTPSSRAADAGLRARSARRAAGRRRRADGRRPPRAREAPPGRRAVAAAPPPSRRAARPRRRRRRCCPAACGSASATRRPTCSATRASSRSACATRGWRSAGTR